MSAPRRSAGPLALAKRLFKRTPAYRAYRALALHHAITTWSADDGRRLGFYGALVGQGQLCFDVGANIGNRTKVLLRLGCQVVAVDPQPSCLRILRRYYGRESRLTIEPVAMGERPGETVMSIARESTVSTMAPEWQEAVVGSGRFEPDLWTGERITVPVMTLDQLIARHGRPQFIKIDVEGFELPVLRGLTSAPRYLSFEFTPELMPSMQACIAHCQTLGQAQFNISLGESMVFHSAEWLGAEAFLAFLAGYAGNTAVFGDVYARFG